MIPKVDSATAAIESGVEKVQFVDGRIPHSVLLEIFTDAGVDGGGSMKRFSC